MGPRAGLDGRKITSPPVSDPGPSRPNPTELPGPHTHTHTYIYIYIYIYIYTVFVHIYIKRRCIYACICSHNTDNLTVYNQSQFCNFSEAQAEISVMMVYVNLNMLEQLL